MSALAEAAFHPCRQADAGFPKFIAQAICRGQCLVPALMKCRVQKLDLPRVPLKARPASTHVRIEMFARRLPAEGFALVV